MITSSTKRITRDDIEAKLREVAGEVDREVQEQGPKIVAGAVAGLLVLVLLAYLFGRRSGRKRSAVVEIRRL